MFHEILNFEFFIEPFACDPKLFKGVSTKIVTKKLQAGAELYLLGAHANARIADLSIQTPVDSQSDTKYTPRRYSSLMVFQCIQSLRLCERPTALGPPY